MVFSLSLRRGQQGVVGAAAVQALAQDQQRTRVVLRQLGEGLRHRERLPHGPCDRAALARVGCRLSREDREVPLDAQLFARGWAAHGLLVERPQAGSQNSGATARVGIPGSATDRVTAGARTACRCPRRSRCC